MAGRKKKISWLLMIVFCAVFFSSCAWAPRSREYRRHYAYLKHKPTRPKAAQAECFVVILVNARHLDYSGTQGFLRTMAKHPSDGSMNGDVGHAWIYLQGKGECLEGGHSGELGIAEPKYLDGIMDLVECGDPNPVRYLRRTLSDGFFQEGAGGHSPTYAVKVNLSEAQYQAVKKFIGDYDYSRFSLTRRQCVTFVREIAKLSGLNLDTDIVLSIAPRVKAGKCRIRLWEDAAYSAVVLSSPDVLEESMMRAVREGRAEYALDWYRVCRFCPKRKWEWERLPARVSRVLYFY